MSETRDKRRRNDLDLFVLALIESGISTPYELKTTAGLSPGATIPALRRLLEESLILKGKPGPRGRTGHKITAEGRRYLNIGWKDLIEDGPSGDLDADLRVALLAIWVGGDRQLAADFLRQSATQNIKSIAELKNLTSRPRFRRLPSGTVGCVRLQRRSVLKENPPRHLQWQSRCPVGRGKSGPSPGLESAL